MNSEIWEPGLPWESIIFRSVESNHKMDRMAEDGLP